MSEGGKGFSQSKAGKSPLKSPASMNGKDDGSVKSKRGKKVQFDSEGSPEVNFTKLNGKFDAMTTKGDQGKIRKGDKAGKSPTTKEPPPLKLRVEQDDSKSPISTSTASILARNAVTNARFAVEIFDGTGHFGMWQSEVLDVLFQQGLDIAIEEEEPDDVEEKEWKMINRMACGTIRTCLSREQKYAFSKETSASKLWKALEEKFLKKSSQNKLYMKKRLFHFNYVPGTTINDHITSFNQLVTDLMNMDVTFNDEDLVLMLLGSLPDEFELLETTLLHGKIAVSLSEVTAALYSYELRKKERQENTSADSEALVVNRGRSQSQNKGRKGRSKSKSRLSNDECVFCREKGH